MKKWKLFLLPALFAALLGMAVACGGEETPAPDSENPGGQTPSDPDNPGGQTPSDPDTPTKVTLRLAGETAGGDGSYSLSLEEGGHREYTIVVGTLTDYTLTAESSAPAVATATATESTLSVEAVSAGDAVITLSEENGKANDLTLNVTVTADPGSLPVVPENVIISNTQSGDGTAETPYAVTFSTAATSTHNIVVQPNGAVNTFTYLVGTLEEGVFTETPDAALTATQENTTLTLESEEAGDFVVQATSTAGDYVFYIRVTVTEYKALTGIETNLTESDEDGFDYVFETAKGTTWDMTNGISARGQALLDGQERGGYQKPLNATYFPSLYTVTMTPVPADASSTSWVISSTDREVFTLNPDGSWVAAKAGTAEITVTNSAAEASIKIKVTVNDTIAEGVLKSEYDNATADTVCNWGFDNNNPSDWTDDIWNQRKGMFEAWHLVMNRTIDPDGIDGNQKFFYLGETNRVYGICIETQSKSSPDTVLALVWAKVTVPDQATTITMSLGNNDKTQGKYRVLFVDGETGEETDLSNGWVDKSKPNDDGKPYVEYDVESLRGKTGALIIQAGQNEQNNNCELHFKGAWINGYTAVTGVTVEPNAATVGQKGEYQLNVTVQPANASHKEVTYAVTTEVEGGEGKVHVSATGLITIDADAPVGEYTVTVTSTDNDEATATFTLTVQEYHELTEFTAKAEYGGRELALEELNGSEFKLTYDANGRYTDPEIQLSFSYNEDASVKTYDVTFGTADVLSVDGGKLTIVGAGTTTVTITPTDNADLAITFTVTVEAFDESTSFVEDTLVTKTFAALMGVDESTGWNNSDAYHKFVFATVAPDDIRHGNAKVNFDGNQMQLESHVTVANSDVPVNIGYNKVKVEAGNTWLTFETHGHGDDRYLESANLRVRVMYLETEEWHVDTLLKWTTVANRQKQHSEDYKITLDLSAYEGKEVIILFEVVGGLQNNGNFPADSDSSAGGYLYLKNIAIGEKAEGAIEATDGNIADETYRRMYAHNSLTTEGWEISANKDSGCYSDNVYAPLTLKYTGSLDEVKTLTLATTTFYDHNTHASLYPWGVFPALNNSHEGHALEYVAEAEKESIFTVAGGVITPVGNGEGYLTVKAFAYGSDTDKVEFKVKVVIEAKSYSVTANTTQVSIEAGGSYTLDYYTTPSEQAVTYAVTEKPDEATDPSKYSVEGGTFTTESDAAPGKYVVTITMTGHEEATATVEITVLARVTVWGVKGQQQKRDAILDANTGWTVNGDWDQGVGEGADIKNKGYLSRNITVKDGERLYVQVRIFAREGETNPLMYVSVTDGGVETRIQASKENSSPAMQEGANTTVEINSSEGSEYGNPQGFYYDLSAYAGKTVEIRIGVDQGTHCVITYIQLGE